MKSKNLIRIITLFLVIVFAFAQVACGEHTKEESESVKPQEKEIDSSTVEITDDMFFANGKTDYKLVYPSQTDQYLDVAISDFQTYFEGSTGAKIAAIKDSEAVWNENAKYISIGQTSVLSSSGLKIGGESLPCDDAYQIKNSGKSVFINGGNTTGTLFGVYKFMYYEFGFETFTSDEIVVRTSSTIPLLDFDVTEVPDIAVRTVAEGDVYDTGGYLIPRRITANRMFLDTDDGVYITINTRPFHNSFEYVPLEEYSDHTSWYSPDKAQLCYTARGNASEYKGLLDVVVSRMKEEIVNQPYGRFITVSQQDGGSWCNCSACSSVINKYGAESATNLLFINDCAKEINRWLKASSGDSQGAYTDDYAKKYGVAGNCNREITIGMFAYMRTQSAPVTTDGNGNVVSTIKDVTLENNLAVLIAPISASYNKKITDEVNKSSYVCMQNWGKVLSNIWMWYYSQYEYEPYIPFNNMNIVRDNYIAAKEIGATYIFEEGYEWITKGPSWRALKTYLYSKLLWDLDSDLEKYTDRFMEHYYDGAAEIMGELYKIEREWMAYTDDVLGRSGVISRSGNAMSKDYWPKNVLTGFLEYIDRAYEAIDGLKKTDPKRYSVVYDRILTESITYRYLLLANYKSSYIVEFEDMKQQLINDAKHLGYTQVKNGRQINITVLEKL